MQVITRRIHAVNDLVHCAWVIVVLGQDVDAEKDARQWTVGRAQSGRTGAAIQSPAEGVGSGFRTGLVTSVRPVGRDQWELGPAEDAGVPY